MKKITIVYNSTINDEIMGLLAECNIKSYTKIENVFGCGSTSGPHLGNNVWPGKNDLIFAIVADSTKDIFLGKFKNIKTQFAKEGLKTFIENVEEII